MPGEVLGTEEGAQFSFIFSSEDHLYCFFFLAVQNVEELPKVSQQSPDPARDWAGLYRLCQTYEPKLKELQESQVSRKLPPPPTFSAIHCGTGGCSWSVMAIVLTLPSFSLIAEDSRPVVSHAAVKDYRGEIPEIASCFISIP